MKMLENDTNGMLEGEMEHHLGYQKHDKSYKSVDNRRNGHYSKTVIAGDDTLEIAVPRGNTPIYRGFQK